MTIVVHGVKCAHKCGNGVRLAAGVELKEQIAALELLIIVAANLSKATDCNTGVIRSCTD